MKTIVFEWSDYEQLVAGQSQIDLQADIFTSQLFDLKQAQGYENICVFVHSKLGESDILALAQSGTKRIVVRAAGFNNIDLKAAKMAGIEVCRVASYSPASVAEHVFALLLNLARKLNIERAKHVAGDEKVTVSSLGMRLMGKTIGLYGMGKIGQEVARIAHGFGMKVRFFDPIVSSLPGVEKVNSLEELVSDIDVLSVHVPLTAETENSVDSKLISLATRSLYLINVARGGILDSTAVKAALAEGKIVGLGIDVWREGDIEDNFSPELLTPNVIQTDHIAFLTYESVQEILLQTRENLLGKPREENIL